VRGVGRRRAALSRRAAPRRVVLSARRLRPLRGARGVDAARGSFRTRRRASVAPRSSRAPRRLSGLRLPAAARACGDAGAAAPRPLGPSARGRGALSVLRPADPRRAAALLRRGVLVGLRRLDAAAAPRSCASLTRADAVVVPQRPPRGCATPGCPELARGRARCDAHDRARRAEIDSTRPSATRRGYDALWRRIRIAHLRREPLCRFCEAKGVMTAATEVDHIVALADGGTHDDANLRSLCHFCHSARTARDQAFGRRHHRKESR